MYQIETTKHKVSLIAPELIEMINGVTQKSRLLVQTTDDKNLVINDREYIVTEEEPTIEEIVDSFVELINDYEDAEVAVVNVGEDYFDIRGLNTDSLEISGLTQEILIQPVTTDLWDLFAEDIADIVNEDTFKDEIERAQRYLMAHMLTFQDMKLGRGKATNSARVGDISVQYADPLSEEGLGLTGYGTIYKGIYLKNRRLKFTRSC